MPMQPCFRDGRFRNEWSRNQAGTGRHAINPFLDRLVRRVVLFGALLVVALPVARGSSDWFGALPLWLVGMPLASWWALHRFRLPWRWVPGSGLTSVIHAGVTQAGFMREGAWPAAATRRRSGRPQARRWAPTWRLRQRGMPRVA